MNEENKPMTENESCAPSPAGEAPTNLPAAHEVPEVEAAKSAIPQEQLNRMTNDIIAAIKTVYDPEIPVDIFELGLIYKIDISDDRLITIDMTLTAPGCPVAGEMPIWVQDAVSTVEGVMEVKVEMVFDPPWDMSRMSEEAQIALNMY